jgi:mevalonate pyrophosphate decarboxylase
VSKAENLVIALGEIMSKPIKIQYKQNGKYYEFWLDGELKERASEVSTLMQKVKKYKIGIEIGLEKFL